MTKGYGIFCWLDDAAAPGGIRYANGGLSTFARENMINSGGWLVSAPGGFYVFPWSGPDEATDALSQLAGTAEHSLSPGRWGVKALATAKSHTGKRWQPSAPHNRPLAGTTGTETGTVTSKVKIRTTGDGLGEVFLRGDGNAWITFPGVPDFKPPPSGELVAERRRLTRDADRVHDHDHVTGDALDRALAGLVAVMEALRDAETVTGADREALKALAKKTGNALTQADIRLLAKTITAGIESRHTATTAAAGAIADVQAAQTAHKTPALLSRVRIALVNAWDLAAHGGAFPLDELLTSLLNLEHAIHAYVAQEGPTNFALNDTAITALLGNLPPLAFKAPVSLATWTARLTAAATPAVPSPPAPAPESPPDAPESE